MKVRTRKFHPPKVSDPPQLVEIEWIDAQSEIDYEGPAKKAGGLVLLPTAGYHVRNGKHEHHGRFVVVAREWFREEETGAVYTRDTTTIPTGWIRSWKKVTALEEIWPGVEQDTLPIKKSGLQPKEGDLESLSKPRDAVS